MSAYPINLDLVGRPCLVVGGGRVAERKIAGLLAAGAAVTVVAPEISDRIRRLDGVRHFDRPYRRGEVASYRLAITCTDDPAVNAQVAADADTAAVWVNSADDPANCSFTLPAVARRGDIQLAFSTGGSSPALATWLRRRAELELDERYERLLDLLRQVRTEVQAQFGTSEIPGWQEALDDGLFDLVASGDDELALARLREHLGLRTAAA